MKNAFLISYFVAAGICCSGFTTAAVAGWKAPSFGVLRVISSGMRSSSGYGGRSFGGSWGGGK
ncbi:hypothetical protein SV7mr_32320 [Stieleria bergensis]|uniref:Lipoprotein n=1 Tax=Stieleria bergensis TaxID=2528025 RepID=A0A517SX37_9BACT|nr:MAG: hypothetical protein CBB71_05785 [Rhodopirellula sp. TMED11]QDT60706.1 hypothetical protein SV7mr_32320 [Planctomycetes bacterium SV_7m_r]